MVLAGGTGGAKLPRGLLDVTDELVVVANSADDTEAYGVHVAPDPDLVAYWLADSIGERGYGVRGDTWQVMDALEEAGEPTWFRLGDQDSPWLAAHPAAAGRSAPDRAHAAVSTRSACPHGCSGERRPGAPRG